MPSIIHDYLGKTLVVAGFVLMLNSTAGVVGNLTAFRKNSPSSIL